MALHPGPFVGTEAAGLQQDLVADADLADVVHQAGQAQRFERFTVQTSPPADLDAQAGHLFTVPQGVLVAALQRIAQAGESLKDHLALRPSLGLQALTALAVTERHEHT